ncbi:hypothetical protein KKC63_02210 [Patescibacteria group bacterium]|nr:hypothetical protein [Patescibacteria group bacterium]
MNISKKGKAIKLLVALIFILIGISLRVLPHPPNFAPIAAIALFGGVYFSKKISLTIPILAMMVSDIFLGFYQPILMAFVYGSFILCVILGFWLKKHKKWQTVLGSSLLAGLIFFLLTNLAVWAFTPWYAKSISGLVQCYLMALPFFRMTLLGNLFYVTIFFGAYEIIEIWIREKFRVIATTPIFVNAKI